MSQTGVIKLLIAEDRTALRKLIRDIVCTLVGEIRECTVGDHLAGMYLAWRPDFVLIDAEMKQMDSIGAVRWIQALDSSARVILVSGYDSVELRDRAERAGVFGYVLKENLLELSNLLAIPR